MTKFILVDSTFINIEEIVSISCHEGLDQKTGITGYGFAFNLKNGTSIPATSAGKDAFLSQVSGLKDVLNVSPLPMFNVVGIPQLTPPAVAEHKIVLPALPPVQGPEAAPAQ